MTRAGGGRRRIGRGRRGGVGLLALLSAGSCTEPRRAPPVPAPAPLAAPSPSVPAGRFELTGTLSQGGLVRGLAPPGTIQLALDDKPVQLAPDRRFVIGFDRDAGPAARLVATLADGRQVSETLPLSARQWDISRLTTLPKIPLPAPEFDALRPAELAAIGSARNQPIASDGWRQSFLWPAIGRISTLFGSQRIYANGEAGSYHSGLDIAKPTGSIVLAPADGVVTLATDRPFTLEGRLVLLAHGGGVESSFMHLARIDVVAGQAVHRGQPIGLVGATGRATGPHLHWGMRWGAARIDPLLVAGPMPVAE